jgi:hypothetical protein
VKISPDSTRAKEIIAEVRRRVDLWNRHIKSLGPEYEVTKYVRGSRDKERLVAYPQDPDDAYCGKSKPEYRGTFNAMADRGIHITSYTETSGYGRVTRSYSESSKSSPDSQRKISAPKPFRESSDSDSES